jgi:perosamine synthetase
MIPIYKPYLPKDSLKYAYDAIETGWISSIGDYKNLASSKLCKILNTKKCLLVSNGTVAGHLLIKALKYKHPNIKRIIIPNNVYIAAYNSLLFDSENDFKIICIDADVKTWNADYSLLEETPDENTAFYVVHNMGNPVNVPALKRKFPNSIFIEDNCEGIFGEYEQKCTGTESFCSSLSFFGNKNITTGEGGAVLINDEDVFNYIHKVHGQGQTETRFIHDVLGYNYRMTNVHAALLLGQLDYYNEIKQKKNVIFNTFKKYLMNTSRIYFQQEEYNCVHSKWMFGVRIEDNQGYDKARNFFESKGIETRPLFYPINKHKHLNDIVCSCNIANLLNKECVILPSYPELREVEIEYISDCVREYLKK